MFTLALLWITMTWASTPQHRNNRHHKDSSSSSSSSSSLGRQGVAITPDSGIYPFTFGKGNEGNWADQYFYFYLPSDFDNTFNYQLLVTDCYCGGDRFVIRDEKINTDGPTAYALSTCSNATPKCNVFYDDPQECVFLTVDAGIGQNDLCFARFEMAKDTMHNISIQVATSPFGSGTGFVWLAKYDVANNYPRCANSPYGWNNCLLTVNDY